MSLSSAEAELGALTTALQDGIFLKNLMEELGSKFTLNVFSDSSAARAIATRQGVSPRVKHLSIKSLFCQEVFGQNLAKLCRVGTRDNPADVLTKAVNHETLLRLRPSLGLLTYGSRDAEVNGDKSWFNPVSHELDRIARKKDIMNSGVGRAAGPAGTRVETIIVTLLNEPTYRSSTPEGKNRLNIEDCSSFTEREGSCGKSADKISDEHAAGGDGTPRLRGRVGRLCLYSLFPVESKQFTAMLFGNSSGCCTYAY